MTLQEFNRKSDAQKAALKTLHNVIDQLEQLDGWRILGLERHKPGVVKYAARRGMEFKIGYAKDSVFQQLQLPPP